MVKILVIQKTGELKNSNLNSVEVSTLYKKAGFRNDNHFAWRASWPVGNKYITLYAKNNGRESTINKYDLPPPADKELYYGNMLCIMHDHMDIGSSTQVFDLTVDEWEKCYEKLFGGFEELGEEDSYSSEEEIPEHLKTKEGYSKEDGFVVDSEDDGDYIPEQEDDDGDDEDQDKSAEEETLEDVESADSDETEEEEDTDELEYESGDDEVGSELSEEDYVSD
jgi:hypothetical protein